MDVFLLGLALPPFKVREGRKKLIEIANCLCRMATERKKLDGGSTWATPQGHFLLDTLHSLKSYISSLKSENSMQITELSTLRTEIRSLRTENTELRVSHNVEHITSRMKLRSIQRCRKKSIKD